MPDHHNDPDATQDSPASGCVDTSAPTAGAILREQPGQKIGAYKLLQRLGEGGFGSVFLAEQEHPVRRQVALKIIKLGMDTRQVVARFEQERQALAIMDHPGIARVLDAGATETGRPYFVMELVKGEPIVEYCDRQNLSIPERLDLFAQMCAAVQHAHTKGIIHRDLKPSNILVSTQDGKPAAKIIDFGIAKATAAKLTDKTLFTEHRQLIGTPDYMSPEQAEGSLDIDTRTDVYSLGVILYELLTGTTPYTGTQLQSAAYADIHRIIREIDPPKPSTRLSDNTKTIAGIAAKRKTESHRLGSLLKGELDWIVMKAMDKDRGRRYETANGLGMDVRRYLAGEPVLAAPPSAAYRVRKFAKRHRASVAGASAVAAALVVGVVGFAWQAARATNAESLAKARLAESEATVKFLDDMLGSADPSAAGKDVSVRSVLDQSARSLDEKFTDQPLTAARLHSTIGRTYLRLALYDDAKPHVEKALSLYTKERGERHPDTAHARNLMGLLLVQNGQHADAEPFLKKAIDEHTAWFGRRHEVTIESMDALATMLGLQMRNEEAEPVLKEVLESQIATLGRESIEAVNTMSTLATLYGDIGRFDEGEAMFRDATSIAERITRADHPMTLSLKSNHAWMMYWRARHGNPTPEVRSTLLESARVLGEQALAARERVLGPEHHETMTSVNNLAVVYFELGRVKESEALRRRDLEVSIRTLGEEHPDSITTQANFGAFLLKQKRFDEALPHLEKAVALSKKVLPPDSPGTAFALGWYGTCLTELGRFAEAEKPQLEARDIIGRAMPADHPIAGEMTKSLVQLYEAWDKAEPGKGHDAKAAEWRKKLAGEGLK
ncbi:MAG: serine/threonine protein kinase [Phycisphaerales bacterium]|nr:serine/threonine protein kinase [Phycisphaerales bacterium]